ncbi:MAG: sialate O-acetylesterase [Terrimicrobiaceae bacterium]
MKLASLFSQHMVLQREMEIPVWGRAEPGSRITVELAGHSATATAGADGKWMVRLPTLAAGGPHTLTARTPGSDPLVVSDVLVGEVWICSGQSNMEFPLSGATDAEDERKAANFPQIRHFKVPRNAQAAPQTDTDGCWEVCAPETARDFSAVAYFYGLELHRRLDVPVGLINSSWGGTVAEAWTSREGLLAEPELQPMVAEFDRLLASDDSEVLEQRRKVDLWQQTYINRPTPPNLGLTQGWAGSEASPADWMDIPVPGYWQLAGLNFSGVVWYRREVDIPDDWEGKDLALGIGACDKSEWTYFNGEFVGSLTLEDTPFAWSAPRVYSVPGRLVKAGKNVIAVRVYSHLYDAGMTGPHEALFVRTDTAGHSDVISLAGTWSCRVEHNFGIVPSAPPTPPGPDNPGMPWVLCAGMIAPLVPYAVRGAIWYQGESNADRPHQYRTLFPALIRDWRRLWGQDHLHFHFVQLANFMAPPEQPGESRWAELREAQTMALALPDTGMAVIIDVGEETDIHPKSKQDVGRRLACSVLAKVHGLADITASGPLYKSFQVEGAQIRIAFDGVKGGLEARGGVLKAFAIAGTDRTFVWADAKIDGETIIVSSPKVLAPVAVRYGWADNPPCNLYNKARLPASPFRTDNFPTNTPNNG